jgi:RNA polymerase sigma-70 factor, ECF subfamily
LDHEEFDSRRSPKESRRVAIPFLDCRGLYDMSSPASPETFEVATAPFRRELTAHCYRMAGSVHDAEDLVQETYVRAWRSFDRFENRSSLRTWLYHIATNVCLTFLARRRRHLPSTLAGASADICWIEPVADRLVIDETEDPATVAATRDSVRLALVASLQLLPPRQRAVLILCDVLAWPAADVAIALDISSVAVKSLLQRARRRLGESGVDPDEVTNPNDREARRVVERYMTAFETSDMAAIEALLTDDAVLEMTGTGTWFAGKAHCVPFIAAHAIGSPGDWQLVPLRLNGRLGCAAYARADSGTYEAFALVVLATRNGQLARISLFPDRSLFTTIGEPTTIGPITTG